MFRVQETPFSLNECWDGDVLLDDENQIEK